MGSNISENSSRPIQRQRKIGDGGEPEINLNDLEVDSQKELRKLEKVPDGFYSSLPANLSSEEVREYLPWWVETGSGGRNKGASGRGTSSSLHFPEEGSTREDIEKLCNTPVSATLTDKDIPVHPKGFTDICNKCLSLLHQRADE